MATHSSLSSSSSLGHPSTHLWEDEEGVVQMIRQGEGGEQGDPLMPALFAWGQHQALEIIQDSIRDSDGFSRRRARHDASRPSGDGGTVGDIQLWDIARIQVNQGKTQVWNRCGERLLDCEHLFRKADGTPNDVWRGDPGLPSHKQGVRILGTPLGRAEFVEGHREKHGILLDRITKVIDLQSAWLLLLFCAASRANYVLRVVHPENSFQFATHHDAGIRQCFENPVAHSRHCCCVGDGQFAVWIRRTEFEECRTPPDHRLLVKWADTLPMIQERHPVWQTTFWSHCPKAAAGSTWKQHTRAGTVFLCSGCPRIG